MVPKPDSLIDRLLVRRLRDRIVRQADGRLPRPPAGATAVAMPLGSDWGWRPEVFCSPLPAPGTAPASSRTPIGAEVWLFHDCVSPELTLRQLRSTRAEDRAPFGLRVDVLRFEGSFLSLAIDLPQDAARGLRRKHLVRLDALFETEAPLGVFARLNVRHGPNVAQLVREVPPRAGPVAVDFDLAYTRLNENRVEKLWLDLIFERPRVTRITLRDVTLSRRPRAEV
ncbi:hypothetical protein SAMN05444722_2982 [Rhodovulum sp. ES.010]|uniref:DUF6478 family protein n=1 Tax=Rhodovulum sp. ES.010 TaxID=1882821 RepID=UPI000925E7ED|nr:DUF6478 family protein [Rhodovulum sp. ES.010]SIO51799.1 hypothetical protein SAMN05444722_2982 [Rhodovulum sp. ES.010]